MQKTEDRRLRTEKDHLSFPCSRVETVDELFTAADQLAASHFPPMTMDEIQKEVDAVRRQLTTQP